MSSSVRHAVTLLVCCCVLPATAGSYSVDDSIPFSVNFRPRTENLPDLGGEKTIKMTTAHREIYLCVLPAEELPKPENSGPYVGLDELELLDKLFRSSVCSYRLDHYWTYEVCHGNYLRQYHEDREGNDVKVTEFILGKYDKNQPKTSHMTKKPTKKIEGQSYPYYEVLMDQGTLCDINGRPRSSRVLYVCSQSGKNEVYQLKETSTCEYEIVILTPLLCSHPDYRPVESGSRSIDCWPDNERAATKPVDLISLETESIKLRSEKMFEATVLAGHGPGSVRIEIQRSVPGQPGIDLGPGNWPAKPERPPFKPLVDPHIVHQFLRGEYCLYGGSGWWKYEFCYDKKVDQYHEEGKGGPRTVINLGNFDLDGHKRWLRQNPGKRPKKHNRKHVTHFYGHGDTCDVTRKPRSVEVKLKCKAGSSPSEVSLYLLEPKTCEYVLGVESPIICDIIQTADSNGLMSADMLHSVDQAEPPQLVKFTAEDAVLSAQGSGKGEIVEEFNVDDLITAGDYEDYDVKSDDDDDNDDQS